jgi:hypothetical protein
VAEKKEKKCKCGEFQSFSVNKAENGYKISVYFENKKTLGAKAGWYPSSCSSKEFVATSKPEMFARLEKIMSGDCGCPCD